MSRQRQRKRSLSDIPHISSTGNQEIPIPDNQTSSPIQFDNSQVNHDASQATHDTNSIPQQQQSSKKRRNTNDRQARLLAFPVYMNYNPNQFQYQNYYNGQYMVQNGSYTMFPQMQEQPKPMNTMQGVSSLKTGIGGLNAPQMNSLNLYQNGQFPQNEMIRQQLQMQSQNSPVTQMRVFNNSIVFSLFPNSNPSFTFMIDGINPQGTGDNFIRKKVILSSSMISNITFILNQVPFLNCDLPIDLTNYVINGQNYIYFLATAFVQPIFVQIKIDQIDIDFLVKNIILNMQHHQGSIDEIPIDPFASQLDPVSKKRIEIAVRGYVCNHYQCFDLKSFAERAISTNNWSCPICGKPLSPDMLRLYPNYIQIQEEQQSIFQVPDMIPEIEQPTMFQSTPISNTGPSSAPPPSIPEIDQLQTETTNNENDDDNDDMFKTFLNDDDVFQHDHFF